MPSGRSEALSGAACTPSTALATIRGLRRGDRLHLRWDPTYADPHEADVAIIAAPEPDEHRAGDWTVDVQGEGGMAFTILDAEIRDHRLEVTLL